MEKLLEQIKTDMKALVSEWVKGSYLQKGDLFVVGCSTSEIAGEKIGTAGSETIASYIFSAVKEMAATTGVKIAFQCCEHLNRALVVEYSTIQQFHLEEVSVIPVPTAGGSMASYAYRHIKNPAVVEHIQAHAGMDIGETMIGMHLRHVAVPLRFKQRFIGSARVNGAVTRPKLIGGQRAVYERVSENGR